MNSINSFGAFVSHLDLDREKTMEAPTNLMPLAWWAESHESNSAPNHIRRIQEMSGLLALYAGESDEFAAQILAASAYHDIGKIWIEPSMLARWHEKDLKVQDAHREHTDLGYQFLKKRPGNVMAMAAEIARDHHERWNGSGYPLGKRRQRISLAGRIVSLVHFFDESIHLDPQKKRMPFNIKETIDMIAVAAGYYFDPALTSVFCKYWQEFQAIANKYKDKQGSETSNLYIAKPLNINTSGIELNDFIVPRANR